MRRLFLYTFVSYIVMGAATGYAQTAVDPSVLEFDPSPDHASSLVTGYELRIHTAGASSVIQQVPLGKPDVSADGKIRLSLAAILDAYPDAGPLYDATVATIGSGGQSDSTVSNQFSFSACDFTVTPDQQTVLAGSGAFAVLVSARSGCSWGAGAAAGWLSLSGSATGSGNGAATYAVQPNAGAQRATTVTVAGRAVAVVQLAVNEGGSSAVPAAPPSAPINLRVIH